MTTSIAICSQFAPRIEHRTFKDGIDEILILVVNEPEAISKVNVVVYWERKESSMGFMLSKVFLNSLWRRTAKPLNVFVLVGTKGTDISSHVEDIGSSYSIWAILREEWGSIGRRGQSQ